MTKKRQFDVEASFEIDAPAALEAAGGELPKISMQANAGSVMTFGDRRMALDVDGVQTVKASIPLIYGHDVTAGIGHSTKVEARDGVLVVEGVVSRNTAAAREFVASSKNGFPWQASVGGYVRNKINVKKGETYNLHGAEITGPCDVITAFDLFEVSVVEYGADSNTSAVAAKGEEMDEKETPIAAEEKFDDVPDVIEETRAEAAAEIERIAEIKARAQAGDDVLVARAIREGWTPDKFELESLRASRPVAPAAHASNDKIDARALEVVALRAAGFSPSETKYTDQELTAADKLGGIGLRGFFEQASGENLYSRRNDMGDWLRAAFSTQNLSYVLTRSVNAILLEAFNYTDSSWRKIFKVGRVNDFKTAYRYRLDSNFEMEELTDGGKLKHGEIADSAFSVQASTFGKMFAITRKDIVNDDLGALTDIPRQLGFGAAETINKKCWSLFLNPGNASDGAAFYNANKGSLKAAGALTLENLSAARASFVTRSKAKGTSDDTSPLGIVPTILAVPTSLEDTALMLTKATLLNNGATANNPANYNPNVNRFQVVGVPFLEYSGYTGNSATTWYLLTDPNRLAAFEISFLNGRQAPTVERADADFDTLGVQFRAFIDFGVSAQDRRGVLKCTIS